MIVTKETINNMDMFQFTRQRMTETHLKWIDFKTLVEFAMFL